MAVLVIAEHDNASLKQDTAKVVAAAKAIGEIFTSWLPVRIVRPPPMLPPSLKRQ